MKNQNFGDNRDLLKFDLVYQILNKGLVKQFNYIPMLTPDIPQKEEPHFCRHEATGGTANQVLMSFLDNSIINETRNISQLTEFFHKQGFKANIYALNKFFTHINRQSYFKDIPNTDLAGSLILVDPDKGLEERVSNDGNLLYSDLQQLYERIEENSYLMFTQRFPENLFSEYLEMRTAEIQDLIPGTQPISLDDLDTIIFFLTKSKSLESRLLQLLKEYTQKYVKK